jgi:hypothetical protein
MWDLVSASVFVLVTTRHKSCYLVLSGTEFHMQQKQNTDVMSDKFNIIQSALE